MKKTIGCAALAALLLILGGCGSQQPTLETSMDRTCAYLQKQLPDPTVDSVAGDWAVLGMARSGRDVSQSYYDRYYENVTAVVQQCQGQLDSRKYTEYSRASLALRSIGKDPSNVAGYNLLEPLGDFDKTVWQGVNGPIWALIALNSGGDEAPENPQAETQATRTMYVEYVLDQQLEDGGWTLAGTEADPDMTAMALQALSADTDQPDVQTAVDRGLEWLSRMQNENGGFTYQDVSASESTAQAIVALTSLGISLDDARFVKNDQTLLDNLLSFQLKNGAFVHAQDGTGENLMATEQAFYAMAAAWRAENGMTSLYDMEDVR